MILSRIETMLKTIVTDVSSSGSAEKMEEVERLLKVAAYELANKRYYFIHGDPGDTFKP